MYANGSGLTQLTNETGRSVWPEWSPDLDPQTPGYQGKIAYKRDDIWVMDPNGANKTQITAFGATEYGIGGPAWSPDGQFIAFSVNRLGGANADVWVYGPILSGNAALARLGVSPSLVNNLSTVCRSPDLSDTAPGYQGKLLFTSWDGVDRTALGTYAIDVQITTDGVLSWDSANAPMVSTQTNLRFGRGPVGLRACASEWNGANYHLCVSEVAYDSSTGTLTVGAPVDMTPDPTLYCEGGRWNADGTKIVYAAGLRVVDPGGGVGVSLDTLEIHSIVVPNDLSQTPTPTRLINNKVSDEMPAWSPPVI